MIRLGKDGLPIGRKRSNYSNIDGILHKRCTHCGNHYRLSYFYPLKYRRNGTEHETLQSWCKFCMATEINENIKKKNSILKMNKARIFIESNSVRLSEHSGDYEAISKHNALIALKIHEKEYAWHDLTTKPDDLPEHREIVVVKMKFDMYHYAIAIYNQIDGMWYLRENDEFYQTNKEVIKWLKVNE